MKALRRYYSTFYVERQTEKKDKELILERVPMVLGYGIYIGLIKFCKSLPKD